MMTYNDIADDILATMGMVHDDAVLNRAAVSANVGMVINRLKRRSVQSYMVYSGDRSSGDSVTIYPAVPVYPEDALGGRLYFELPSDVLDIGMNGGISYIAYSRTSQCADNLYGRHFTMCSASEADILDGMTMQKPGPSNPYYFRHRLMLPTGIKADRVGLLGVSPLIQNLEVGLYLAVDFSSASFDPDTPADIPLDMLYHVKRIVLDMGRWALLVPQERLKNDGRDMPMNQPMQPPQTLSVNDPINTEDF